MKNSDSIIGQEMLENGKIISEEFYNDGKRNICFRFVEYGGCVFYITTWDDEVVYVRFDHKI